MACFCAVQQLPSHGGFFSYLGYICDNGVATTASRTFGAAQVANATTPPSDPCKCDGTDPNCPQPISSRIKLKSAHFITLYEKGVPNPNNPLHAPDEAFPLFAVINGVEEWFVPLAEYVAILRSGQRFRLIQTAFSAPPPKVIAVLNQAFLIDRRSPPASVYIPVFSEARGEVTVQVLAGQSVLIVKGLGQFDVQAT